MNEEALQILEKASFPNIIFTSSPGLISKAMRWYLDIKWCHVAVCMGDGEVIDAQNKAGVSCHSIYDFMHGDWFLTSLKVHLSDMQTESLRDFLRDKLGCKYDYYGAAGFITKFKRNNKNNYFCSEIVASGFNYVRYPLVFRAKEEKSHPPMLFHSLALQSVAKYVHSTNKLTVF